MRQSDDWSLRNKEPVIKSTYNNAEETHRQLRQIEARKQSPDHPVLWNVPETDYLKFYLFQVLSTTR